MRTVTYPKTTPPTTNTTSRTDPPEIGSDEYMIGEGYRVPTETERKHVGRFTRHLTLRSIFVSWFRRQVR